MRGQENRTALVLSGGGARAAYEVGVLRALAERSAAAGPSAPFSIFCGSSAGALNAAGLALSAEDFAGGVRRLTSFWLSLQVGEIHRPARRWLSGSSRMPFADSKALFDPAPLADRLARELDFGGLGLAISDRVLRALCVTCLGYASGQLVSFFQGRADLEPWQHRLRVGAHVGLDVKHVLASMAMPFLFPAVKLNREYFGDGAMRDFSPLSPAVHLGAERIVAIGTGGAIPGEQQRSAQIGYPSLAELGGRMLSGADGLASDVERMRQVNRLLDSVPPASRSQLPWRSIDLLLLEPSRSLESLAIEVINELPKPARSLLSRLGDLGDGLLASHVLFEPAYLEKLIDLGYRDALASSGEIDRFWSPKID